MTCLFLLLLVNQQGPLRTHRQEPLGPIPKARVGPNGRFGPAAPRRLLGLLCFGLELALCPSPQHRAARELAPASAPTATWHSGKSARTCWVGALADGQMDGSTSATPEPRTPGWHPSLASEAQNGQRTSKPPLSQLTRSPAALDTDAPRSQVSFLGKRQHTGVPGVAQRLTNPTSIREDAALIPGLAPWVKDLAWLWLWWRPAAAAPIGPRA